MVRLVRDGHRIKMVLAIRFAYEVMSYAAGSPVSSAPGCLLGCTPTLQVHVDYAAAPDNAMPRRFSRTQQTTDRYRRAG